MNYSLIEDNKGIISFMLFLQVKQTLHTLEALGSFEEIINTAVKSAPIRSYFWSVFSPTTGKYGPEKTAYLGTFRAAKY